MNYLLRPKQPDPPSSFSTEVEPSLQPDDDIGPDQWLSLDLFMAVLFFILITLTGCTFSPAGNGAGNAAVPPAAVVSKEITPPPATVPPSEPGPTFTPLPVSQAAVEPPEAVEEQAPASLQSLEDKLPLPVEEPEIGPITFALDVTQNYEPVEANLLFSEGITQVHAIFTYKNMQAGYTWERIWFFNDKEVARKSSVWSGPAEGDFDYFIDNSERALPRGDWILELHVEGQLRGLGAFVIEEAEAIDSSQ